MRRWPAVAAVAAALALAACGGSAHPRRFGGGNNGLGGPTTAVPGGSTTTTTAPGSPTTLPTAPTTIPGARPITVTISGPIQGAAPTSPEYAAGKYVEAYNGISYRWPFLGYWVLLAKPYTAPAVWRTDYALVVRAMRLAAKGEGDTGDAAYFNQIKSQGETVEVEIEKSALETNAPNTARSAYVLVTWTTITYTYKNELGVQSAQVQADQCHVVKTGGRWGVEMCGAPNAN